MKDEDGAMSDEGENAGRGSVLALLLSLIPAFLLF